MAPPLECPVSVIVSGLILYVPIHAVVKANACHSCDFLSVVNAKIKLTVSAKILFTLSPNRIELLVN